MGALRSKVGGAGGFHGTQPSRGSSTANPGPAGFRPHPRGRPVASRSTTEDCAHPRAPERSCAHARCSQRHTAPARPRQPTTVPQLRLVRSGWNSPLRQALDLLPVRSVRHEGAPSSRHFVTKALLSKAHRGSCLPRDGESCCTRASDAPLKAKSKSGASPHAGTP